MKTSERTLRTSYVVADYLSTIVGVVLFTLVRFFVVPDIRMRFAAMTDFFGSPGFKLTVVIFPVFMLLLYYLSGYYVNVSSKSRVKEFLTTVVSVAIGSFIFFMVVLLNDVLPRRVWNYEILLIFFLCLFVPVYLVRLLLTSIFISRGRKSGQERVLLLTDKAETAGALERVMRLSHKKIAGMMLVPTDADGDSLTVMLSKGALRNKLKDCGATSFMIAFAADNPSHCMRVLGNLYPLDCPIYVSPDDFMLLLSKVTYDNLLSEPLVDISRSTLSDSVVAMKRAVDVCGSFLGLVIVAPVIAVLAVIIKLKSPGPVFFSQERVGYHRKPFMIHKLRTMIPEAEASGPSLSKTDDPRVTAVGRVMRKYRLDELPNLWNVLIGDMSLVGPRPEREYYLTKLHAAAPHCTLLHQVRPGLTSLGMVKFGYASTVDDMVARLKYDLLYIQNISISLDIKIVFYTVRTIVRGEGK
ncbi:MAG: exopolysaccharide biosynthesis polyprenyl glycosylphosphotransferase [Staphylococcus sp.]|nr:exopolysaccharide biosynthesis polyprenyl glycosylphosphotransferase [Staphylococcus sp.]